MNATIRRAEGGDRDALADIQERDRLLVQDRAALQRAADAFCTKYADGETGEPFDVFPVLGEEPALFHVVPEVGWAWLEGAYLSHNTRWTF